MGYSVTFEKTSESKNTWTNWNLLPESPPVIPPPKPKMNYVDIPGRTTGPLDLSETIFGHLTYERITGSITFVLRDDYWHDPNPAGTYNTVRKWLHGKEAKMSLEDLPGKYYLGRFTVEPPQRSRGPFTLKINYDLEPVRYNTNGTVDTTWL